MNQVSFFNHLFLVFAISTWIKKTGSVTPTLVRPITDILHLSLKKAGKSLSFYNNHKNVASLYFLLDYINSQDENFNPLKVTAIVDFFILINAINFSNEKGPENIPDQNLVDRYLLLTQGGILPYKYSGDFRQLILKNWLSDLPFWRGVKNDLPFTEIYYLLFFRLGRASLPNSLSLFKYRIYINRWKRAKFRFSMGSLRFGLKIFTKNRLLFLRYLEARRNVPAALWWKKRKPRHMYWLISRKRKAQKSLKLKREAKRFVFKRYKVWARQAYIQSSICYFRNPRLGRWWSMGSIYPRRRDWRSSLNTNLADASFLGIFIFYRWCLLTLEIYFSITGSAELNLDTLLRVFSVWSERILPPHLLKFKFKEIEYDEFQYSFEDIELLQIEVPENIFRSIE